jgi:hypothetical protein
MSKQAASRLPPQWDSERFMWLAPDRLLYVGILGAPAVRAMGSVTWKRARSLLHYVNRDANLAHVALNTGYPDSTHFSHSIRQIYGMKPKDIFAGSRRLAIYGSTLRQR